MTAIACVLQTVLIQMKNEKVGSGEGTEAERSLKRPPHHVTLVKDGGSPRTLAPVVRNDGTE